MDPPCIVTEKDSLITLAGPSTRLILILAISEGSFRFCDIILLRKLIGEATNRAEYTAIVRKGKPEYVAICLELNVILTPLPRH